MALRYTEDAVRGRIVEWMNDIIKEENLPFDRADAQIEIQGRRFPDIILWETRLVRGALLLELKRPIYDAWEVGEEALGKAWNADIQYFATWNINRFYWWDRYRKGGLYDQLCSSEEVVSIRGLREVDRVERSIKDFLRRFLREFYEVYYKRKPSPLLPLDERFIVRLRSAIDAYCIPVFYKIKKAWEENSDFRKKLVKWFKEQGYTFTGSDEDFEMVARQYVYLLIDKIVFYNTLRPRYELPKIYIRPGTRGERFRRALQNFFDYAIGIDYETIFATDFIDTITPPDEIIASLKHFIGDVSKYDLAKIGYEVIGRVFERLIPDWQRHKLGQYFTRSDVVDLIIGFCVKRPEDVVLDPACGAGTFLVRSYERKKLLDPLRPHEKLLNELYGVDIAKFPAHLSTINLASKDLSIERNYPLVFCKDFFDLKPGEMATLVPYEVKGLDRVKLQKRIPFFDAVVMNPPYTSQVEMESLLFPEGYRNHLQSMTKEEWRLHVGKRSSIYSYFFFHGAKLLKKGKRLGLITSNSWLDVGYGKYLQEFFLKNFRIIALIESKVERWFEDADINTCITILERCARKDERDPNLVKFVQLKKKLTEFIPIVPFIRNKEKRRKAERRRWSSIEKLVNFTDSINERYEDSKIRIFPKSQKELWEEGYDEDSKIYAGSKWGKYIRAPKIFFKILEKSRNLFVPLKEIAKVRRGFTSGANEFFYLTEEKIKKWGIENEFWMHREKGKWIPNYIIKSTRECKSIEVNPKDLKYRVLIIHKDKGRLKGTNVLKYIKWGEEQGFHNRPTCATREKWYDLGIRKPTKILFLRATEDRPAIYVCEAPILHDQTFYSIYPQNETISMILGSLLNSTIINFFFRELLSGAGAALGLGALWSAVYEAEHFLIPTPSSFTKRQIEKLEEASRKLFKRPVSSVFEEIGADSPEEVSLDKVKPDRRELDKITMGEVLGLTDEEQLEVYKAVIDLVKSRIERAKSVKKRKKRIKGIDVGMLVESVLKEAEGGKLRRFPEEYVGVCEYKMITVPKGKVEVGSDLQGFYVKVGEKEIRCKSPHEAKFIQYAVMNGHTAIKTPVDEDVLRRAVEAYEPVLRETRKRISDYLESVVPDKKLRMRIKDEAWKRLWTGPLET